MKVKIENGVAVGFTNELILEDDIIKIGAFAFEGNRLTSVTIEGDATRFNYKWRNFGFPSDLKPKNKIIDRYYSR